MIVISSISAKRFCQEYTQLEEHIQGHAIDEKGGDADPAIRSSSNCGWSTSRCD